MPLNFHFRPPFRVESFRLSLLSACSTVTQVRSLPSTRIKSQIIGYRTHTIPNLYQLLFLLDLAPPKFWIDTPSLGSAHWHGRPTPEYSTVS